MAKCKGEKITFGWRPQPCLAVSRTTEILYKLQVKLADGEQEAASIKIKIGLFSMSLFYFFKFKFKNTQTQNCSERQAAHLDAYREPRYRLQIQ